MQQWISPGSSRAPNHMLSEAFGLVRAKTRKASVSRNEIHTAIKEHEWRTELLGILMPTCLQVPGILMPIDMCAQRTMPGNVI